MYDKTAFICTKDYPWSEDEGLPAVHLEASVVYFYRNGRGEVSQVMECPHCQLRFVPDEKHR